MRKYEHLKQKAVQLRKRRMSLTDICERLGMGKTTVWYWIKDIDVEIARTHRQTRAQKIGSQSNRHKWAAIRQRWYDEAMASVKSDGLTDELRDFVVMYMGEGYSPEPECGRDMQQQPDHHADVTSRHASRI